MSANELHITEGDLPVTHDSAVEAEHLTSMDPQPPHQVDTGGGIEIENTIESTDIDGASVDSLEKPSSTTKNDDTLIVGKPGIGLDSIQFIQPNGEPISSQIDFPDNDDGLFYPHGNDQSLMYKRYEPIANKDFAREVRATLDVEQFVNQAHLILDLPQNNLSDIVDAMLTQIVVNSEKNYITWTIKEAKAELFTHDSVHHLSQTIQGACRIDEFGYDYDQSWVCILCTIPTAQTRTVCVARLKTHANLSRSLQEAKFIILIITPSKEKSTKSAFETARTFATLFADLSLRSRLQATHSEEHFKKLLLDHVMKLSAEGVTKKKNDTLEFLPSEQEGSSKSCCSIGRDIIDDVKRRAKFYISDYVDGIVGPGTMYKTISTVIFLYFSILLPSIALGELNSTNTEGKIDVKKLIYAQCFGGIFFALIGGQPMIILLTTAPLALFTKGYQSYHLLVIFSISETLEIKFEVMYACVGLWMAFFLIMYAISGASNIMKWSTRSTEEIFSTFVAVAFTVDTFKGVAKEFRRSYHSDCDTSHDSPSFVNGSNSSFLTTSDSLTTAVASLLTTAASDHGKEHVCERESSMLYLLLVLATVWLGLTLFNFTKTPFLNSSKREFLADFALPVSVIIISFFGSYIFRDIGLHEFTYGNGKIFVFAKIEGMTISAAFISCGLGFSLSLLFFMDQNITGAMVDSPENRLKKGNAYHWDLFLVGIMNATLVLFGLPMMHGALPHSPLHVLAMADVEDRVDGGVVKQKVVFVRENRVTGIVAHILVGLSLLLLPYPLKYIPPAVLDGIFLYLACISLNGNQFFERLTLLFTEQAQYPPNHYISRVPQRKIHIFTMLQLLQLVVLCAISFAPFVWLKMVFPVIIFLMLPIRHKIIPFLVESKYLKVMDTDH